MNRAMTFPDTFVADFGCDPDFYKQSKAVEKVVKGLLLVKSEVKCQVLLL